MMDNPTTVITITPSINLSPEIGFKSQAEVLLEETKQLIANVSQEIIQKNTFLEFPNIGDERYLYIDRDTNKSYRWNNSDLKYYCVGSNYEDIEIVNGGVANNE